VSKIGRTLRDGTRLLWIFQTVATAEYFRGPRNSITTALHYGKCQWVFNRVELLSQKQKNWFEAVEKIRWK